MNKKISAVAMAVVAVGFAAGPAISASAAPDPSAVQPAAQSQDVAVVSNDLPPGAYLTGTITFDDANNYHSSLVLHDKLADGKAPIIDVFATTSAIAGHLEAGTFACSAGNGGSCSYSPAQFYTPIYSVVIDVCNGGSTSAPQACSYNQWVNPYQ